MNLKPSCPTSGTTAPCPPSRLKPPGNASGQPGISLPLYEGDDGLPLGVQIVGAPAGEGRLLALASQLETAQPWAERRAPTGQAVSS